MVYILSAYPRTHWLHPSRLFDANEPLGNYQGRPAAMPEPLLRIDAMFKFVPDTNVPGFRVGVRDDVPGFSIDENGSVRRPLPAAPSAAVTAPTIFSPAGLSYQGN